MEGFKATDWVRASRASVGEKESRSEMSYSLLLEAECHDPLLILWLPIKITPGSIKKLDT